MIKVTKDLRNIPANLQSKNREDAFDLNIIAQSFDNGKTLYKPSDVKARLFDIYFVKCAYCEKDIDDEPKHIEHYRPKDIYYWLAYSWDNLLLSCGACNISKGIKFATMNEKVVYDNETYVNIHSLGRSYDSVEQPMIINPEKEDILAYLKFDKNGIISSYDARVAYTIEDACKLNKDSLVRKRVKIINIFRNSIEKHYLRYQKNGYKGIDRFEPDIETFIEECKRENEFYSFRYFILNNIKIFFNDVIIQNILIEISKGRIR